MVGDNNACVQNIVHVYLVNKYLLIFVNFTISFMSICKPIWGHMTQYSIHALFDVYIHNRNVIYHLSIMKTKYL